MNWYIKVLRDFATFNGRARRKEYWYFFLLNLIFTLILTFVDGATGTLNPELGLGLLSGIYSLVIFIPVIAVAIRRLHDTGRTGWWFLILLIPLIGAIVFIVFMALDSESGGNKYGPNPKDEMIR